MTGILKERPAKARTARLPSKFGPTFKADFPMEMRRQLWPLCCGASILSGFKMVAAMSEEELDEAILNACDVAIPDFQVYQFEEMKPRFTFLTINSDQAKSPKIMGALRRAGFFLVGSGTPRNTTQFFYLRDTSKTWRFADQ